MEAAKGRPLLPQRRGLPYSQCPPPPGSKQGRDCVYSHLTVCHVPVGWDAEDGGKWQRCP